MCWWRTGLQNAPAFVLEWLIAVSVRAGRKEWGGTTERNENITECPKEWYKLRND